MNPEFLLTMPKDGGGNTLQVPLLLLKSGTVGVFAIGGYVGYETGSQDWHLKVPTHAAIRKTGESNDIGKCNGHIFCHPRIAEAKDNRIPWGILFEMPSDKINVMFSYDVAVYLTERNASGVPVEVTQTIGQFVKTEIRQGGLPINTIRSFLPDDENPRLSDLLGRLYLPLVSVTSPAMGSTVKPGFVAYGSFGPNDSAITRVDIVRNNAVVCSCATPYSSPMGYWAASFSVPGITGRSEGYFAYAVGNASTGITGPFTIEP